MTNLFSKGLFYVVKMVTTISSVWLPKVTEVVSLFLFSRGQGHILFGYNGDNYILLVIKGNRDA